MGPVNTPVPVLTGQWTSVEKMRIYWLFKGNSDISR